MPPLKTVTVKDDNPEGFKVINETDFDPDVHKKVKAPKAAAEPAGDAGDGDPGEPGKPDGETISTMNKRDLGKLLDRLEIEYDKGLGVGDLRVFAVNALWPDDGSAPEEPEVGEVGENAT